MRSRCFVSARAVLAESEAAVMLPCTWFILTSSSRPSRAVAELLEMIEDESRQLLGVVVDRIFTNLKLLTPGFNLSSVTEAAQGEDARRVSGSLREQVDAFCNRFRRAEVAAEDSEEEACSDELEEGATEEVQGTAST